MGKGNLVQLSLLLGILLIANNLVDDVVQAQTSPSATNPNQRQSEQNTLIYINPETGNDRKGDGSNNSPYKTITQALMLAKSGTTIRLAPGTYSQETGETFPLIFKNNITLEGDPKTKGKNTIIKGNGNFISPTSAGQHVTIVTTGKANTITGITVINPHNQGYGLWIESANPKIINNGFINSGNGGVSVNGDSQPVIEDNYFNNILGNGLVVYGDSKPQVKNNEFRKTGFGISILQNSHPILTGNRISENRIGVILQNNSQATFRNNLIEFSEEDGVVAVSNSRPDLGTSDEPGNNIFASNQGVDVRNLSQQQTIPAFGNEISSNTVGKIDLAGNGERIEPIATAPIKSITVSNSDSNNNSTAINRPLPPLKPTPISPQQEKDTPPSSIASSSSTLPPPPPVQNTESNVTPMISVAIPVTVNSSITPLNIPSNTPSNTNTPTYKPTTYDPNRRNLEQLLTLNPNSTSGKSPYTTFRTYSGANSSGEQKSQNVYKVVVDTLNDTQKKDIAKLYPGAFITSYNGQKMWQIGIYNDQYNAEQVLENLNKIGISGLIIR